MKQEQKAPKVLKTKLCISEASASAKQAQLDKDVPDPDDAIALEVLSEGETKEVSEDE